MCIEISTRDRPFNEVLSYARAIFVDCRVSQRVPIQFWGFKSCFQQKCQKVFFNRFAGFSDFRYRENEIDEVSGSNMPAENMTTVFSLIKYRWVDNSTYVLDVCH